MAIDKKYIMDTIDGFIKRTDDEDKRTSIVQLYDSLQGKNSRDEVINELYKNLNRKSEFSVTIDKHRNFFSSGKTTTRSLFDGLFQEIEHEIGSEGNFLLKTSVESNKRGITEKRDAIDLNKGNIAKNIFDITANRDAIAKNKIGIADNANAITANRDAIESNKRGITENRDAIDLNKGNIAKNIFDITENRAAIDLNKGGITANANAITENRTEIQANKGDIAVNRTGIAANAALIQSLIERIEILEENNKKLQQLEQNNNRLNVIVAHDMISIVRLEIATITDQIINSALSMKREITGSGKAELAINIATTLAVLASNAFAPGAMGVIGNVIVQAGKVVGKNLDKSEVEETLQSGVDKVVEYLKETKSVYEDVPKDRAVFSPQLKKTLLVRHGSGGTSAITYDVQQAVIEAFRSVGETLKNDTSSIAAANSSELLQKIGNSVLNPDGLHPLTNEVLKRALDKLSSNGGDEYHKVVPTEWYGEKTQNAKDIVKKTYEIMYYELSYGKSLPSINQIKESMIHIDHIRVDLTIISEIRGQ